MKCSECPSFGPVSDCSILRKPQPTFVVPSPPTISIGICSRVDGSHYNHIISTTHECFEFSPIKGIEAETAQAVEPATRIGVGSILYGFCNGFFGRDSYDDKRIEAMGCDWIVARALTENAKPSFATFEKSEDLLRHVIEWSQPDRG